MCTCFTIKKQADNMFSHISVHTFYPHVKSLLVFLVRHCEVFIHSCRCQLVVGNKNARVINVTFCLKNGLFICPQLTFSACTYVSAWRKSDMSRPVRGDSLRTCRHWVGGGGRVDYYLRWSALQNCTSL